MSFPKRVRRGRDAHYWDHGDAPDRTVPTGRRPLDSPFERRVSSTKDGTTETDWNVKDAYETGSFGHRDEECPDTSLPETLRVPSAPWVATSMRPSPPTVPRGSDLDGTVTTDWFPGTGGSVVLGTG